MSPDIEETTTPAPFARQAEALRKAGCKLQKEGVREKIEALIKEWYPAYLGRFGDMFRPWDDDIHSQQPRLSLILWREQVDAETVAKTEGLASTFGFVLERRVSWSFGYSGRLGGIGEGLAALALFRGLERPGKPGDRFATTYTLTVFVGPPYPETSQRPFREERYIDLETGREWIAQAWQHSWRRAALRRAA